MFGNETLMVAAQRQPLRSLEEPARPFGKAFEIHLALA
jgi:hypothetical protein